MQISLMSNLDNFTKYDDVLTSILVNEKSILGFLSAIFNFLGRRTDFYYVPEGQYENMGFPPGVAEELVIKVLRTCDPKNWKASSSTQKPIDINNEIMCSTVAQEVEVIAADDESSTIEEIENVRKEEVIPINSKNSTINDIEHSKEIDFKNEMTLPCTTEDYTPPVIIMQKDSESYNGAVRDQYTWSQTIMELDVTVTLPPDIKSSKDVKVAINSGDLRVVCRDARALIEDTLPFKIKPAESFWSISEGRLLIHLEKVQERWWNKLLNSEEPIDLSRIDCSRPLDELPEDHIAKVRELQWNQERKMKGLPTSDDLRKIEILKKAWNVEGSPFKGKQFDPSVLNP